MPWSVFVKLSKVSASNVETIIGWGIGLLFCSHYNSQEAVNVQWATEEADTWGKDGLHSWGRTMFLENILIGFLTEDGTFTK